MPATSTIETDQNILPNDVDTETATVDGIYTPQEVKQDAVKYGKWIKEGAWFLHGDDNTPYRLTERRPPYTFDLIQANQIHPDTTIDSTPDKTLDIHSVTELMGELLGGYLKGIPPGKTIKPKNNTTITNTGEYLLVSEDNTVGNNQPQSVAELDIPKDIINPRYTGTNPISVVTPLSESNQHKSASNSNILLAYTVNGSKTTISHLLSSPNPKTTQQPQTQTDQQQSGVTADGGEHPGHETIGQKQSITAVPYFPAEDPSISARFVPTSQHNAATFEEPNIRSHVLTYMQGKVLNACCGPTDLSKWYDDGEIIRNDIDPEIKSDLSVDIAELAAHFKPNTFDCIIYDGPWSTHQSNLRYNGYHVQKSTENCDETPVEHINIDIRKLPFSIPGEENIGEEGSIQHTLTNTLDSENETKTVSNTKHGEKYTEKYESYLNPEADKTQIGHARLSKIGFDYLLKPGGVVIQYAYTGSAMPNALDYERVSRVTFNPTGQYKVMVGCVDKKLE